MRKRTLGWRKIGMTALGITVLSLLLLDRAHVLPHKIPRSKADLYLMSYFPGDSQSVLENASDLTLYSLRPGSAIASSFSEKEFRPDSCRTAEWKGNRPIFPVEHLIQADGDTADFHNYSILGETHISGAAKSRAIETLYKGLLKKASPAFCFNPRLGLRATQNGKTVDLLICFECHLVHIIAYGQESGLTINAAYQPYFDNLLKAAKVPIARS